MSGAPARYRSPRRLEEVQLAERTAGPRRGRQDECPAGHLAQPPPSRARPGDETHHPRGPLLSVSRHPSDNRMSTEPPLTAPGTIHWRWSGRGRPFASTGGRGAPVPRKLGGRNVMAKHSGYCVNVKTLTRINHMSTVTCARERFSCQPSRWAIEYSAPSRNLGGTIHRRNGVLPDHGSGIGRSLSYYPHAESEKA